MKKLMVGSLAGLMIVDGFTETEQNNDGPSGLGLFSVPLELLRNTRTLISLPRISMFGLRTVTTFHGLFPLLKVASVFGVLLFLMFLYLLHPKSATPQKKASATQLSAAPSLASPIEVRRKAWLTSIQTVWVPRHGVIPELAALGLKFSKYIVRLLIGWHGYAWLTGMTEEDEIARVKAWDIAIDAQLAGGDAEICKSRLVLTLLAAGTLPNTPGRLMLKALHLRVLLWRAADSNRALRYVFQMAATKLANYQWSLARELHRTAQGSPSKPTEETDPLPEHLAKLLQMNPDDVMKDEIIQRAYNLACDRPTRENTHGIDVGMDIVVEDFAIRSPLDALAAWLSSSALHTALLTALQTQNGTPDADRCLSPHLDLALHIAPPTSSAQTRVLAARAIFLPHERAANIAAVLAALPTKFSPTAPLSPPDSPDPASIFIDSTTPILACNGIRIAVRCAVILAVLQRASETTDGTLDLRIGTKSGISHDAAAAAAAAVEAKSEAYRHALHRLDSLHIDPANCSLLGFVAAYRLLSVCLLHPTFVTTAAFAHHRVVVGNGLARVAASLRSWCKRKQAVENGLCAADTERVALVCGEVLIGCGMVEGEVGRRASLDTGYGSGGVSEGEGECVGEGGVDWGRVR